MLKRTPVHLFRTYLAFGLIIYLIDKAPEQNVKNRDQDPLWSLTAVSVSSNETGKSKSWFQTNFSTLVIHFVVCFI